VSNFWERNPAISGVLLALPTIAAHAALPGRLAPAGGALLLVSVASVYLGFAFADGSPKRIAIETVGVALYASAALIGLGGSVWVIPAALALHPAWDGMHHPRVHGGAPIWFPTACAVFDLLVAAWIAWRLCL
jgi:uncharacterized protein DUF6010